MFMRAKIIYSSAGRFQPLSGLELSDPVCNFMKIEISRMKEISQAALLQQWHPTTIPHMKFNELFRSTHPFTNVCEGNVNS